MKFICIGDSLTYGYGVAASECWVNLLKEKYNLHIINKGINGDTTSSLLCRWDKDLLSIKPEYVIIMIGTNDFLMGLEPKYVYESTCCMIKEAIDHSIIPIIVCPPCIYSSMAVTRWSSFINYNKVNSNLSSFSELLSKFAKVNCLNFINLYSIFESKKNTFDDLFIDGIHPTAKGHRLIYSNILSLKKDIPFSVQCKL